jgi:hypothetical protein
LRPRRRMLLLLLQQQMAGWIHQLSQLCSHPGARRPLWLLLAASHPALC